MIPVMMFCTTHPMAASVHPCGNPACQSSQPGHLRCTQCSKQWYCSRDCQRADWSAHKPGCKAAAAGGAKPAAQPAPKPAAPPAAPPADPLFDALKKRFEIVSKRMGGDGAKWLVTRSARRASGDDEEEGDGKQRLMTAEEAASLRVVVITKNREKAFERAQTFMDCDGWDGGATHFGNMIIAGIPRQIGRVLRLKKMADQFDELLALTYELFYNDSWLHDNEYWSDGTLEETVAMLGTVWRGMLARSDAGSCMLVAARPRRSRLTPARARAELHIDPEFTRPGVLALLEEFKKLCETKLDGQCYPFNYGVNDTRRDEDEDEDEDDEDDDEDDEEVVEAAPAPAAASKAKKRRGA
jgi:hypothetical protein